MAVLLVALAVCFWVAGLRLHHAYAAAIACHPASSLACNDLVNKFNGMYGFLANGFILQVVPALIGAFVGAPVLARELESGTFRFAWTQGFGRWRWTLAKVVGLGVAVTAATGAISVLFSWYYQPYFPAGSQALYVSKELPIAASSPFAPGLFDLRGVTFAAWTLAAFAIGVLAGVLIRRVVPAIVATLVVYTGLAFAVGGFLRQHYVAPLVTSKLDIPDYRLGDQPAVDCYQERPAGEPVEHQPVAPARSGPALRERWDSEIRHRVAVPRPSRVHAVDHLPAGQPILAIPVDRGGLAARPVGAVHRPDRVARPPPGSLSVMSRARGGRPAARPDAGVV